MLSMIAAMDKNRVIGKDNKMPWHLPADLKWFKQVTMDSPIIMGRKTYDSIGKPLPGRLNIILSRQPGLKITGCTVVNSVENALDVAQQSVLAGTSGASNEVFVSGGAYLYQCFLEQADRLYLTLIDDEFRGDTYFPDYTRFNWKEISRTEYQADEENPHAYSFVTLERIWPP